MRIDQLVSIMTPDDLALMISYMPKCGDGNMFKPNVTLAPEGDPYLFRWHLVYDNTRGNVFFHIQVENDPERPLHDHPWDNQSIILAGGYDEVWGSRGNPHGPIVREFRQGDVIARRAEEAHRLILPHGITYTMTLFTTGPKIREWGFWYPDGWHHNKRHVLDRGGRSTHVHEEK